MDDQPTASCCISLFVNRSADEAPSVELLRKPSLRQEAQFSRSVDLSYEFAITAHDAGP